LCYGSITRASVQLACLSSKAESRRFLMSIELDKLPYPNDALEPFISERTMSIHHGRHHKAYVDKLNSLIEGTRYAGLTLEEIIVRARLKNDTDVFNNAAQAWNHDFFWKSMSPNGGKPDGKIRGMVESDFGSLDAFRKQFRDAALNQFGSGWVWLALDHGKLRIMTSSNADTPAGTELVPIIALDVWEHAYYLDYQNGRKQFAETFLDNLINWNFANSNIDESEARQAA
jgi:superoxide dismutase, Fe-Mn family